METYSITSDTKFRELFILYPTSVQFYINFNHLENLKTSKTELKSNEKSLFPRAGLPILPQLKCRKNVPGLIV